MTDPIFRAPGSIPGQSRAQTKRRPDVDLDSPEARAHADEAQRLEDVLTKLGAPAEMVKPTLDFKGHVRMNFDQIWRLIELAKRGHTA